MTSRGSPRRGCGGSVLLARRHVRSVGGSDERVRKAQALHLIALRQQEWSLLRGAGDLCGGWNPMGELEAFVRARLAEGEQ
jgi:hypothetical protein